MQKLESSQTFNPTFLSVFILKAAPPNEAYIPCFYDLMGTCKTDDP